MSAFDPFAPATIGQLAVRSHFVRSATYLGYADDAGLPTDKVRDCWVGLARGGVGAIISSYTCVTGYERPRPRQLGLWNDGQAQAFRPVVEAVHEAGGTVLVQLVHGSSWGQEDPAQARILGPSALPHPDSGLVPEEMGAGDIQRVVELFAQAAGRAKAAGFDGVQIHGAHDYLLSQFLSPARNVRTDEYGGSPRNRMRFLEQVYAAVRAEVGAGYPVWVKLNSNDEEPNGLVEEDFLFTATRLAQAGIDAIEVSGGGWRRHSKEDRCYYAEAARRLAEAVETPVILTGGLRTRQDVERVAEGSRVRFFGFARPFMRDPQFLDTLRS